MARQALPGVRLPVGSLVRMPDYQPPLDDIRFVLDNVTPIGDLAKLGPYGHADADTVAGVLDEFARVMSDVWAPTNEVGDIEGSTLAGDEVTTPTGFKAAYEAYASAGWGAVPVRRGLRRRRLPLAGRHRHAGDAQQRQHGPGHGAAAHPGRDRRPRPPRQRGAARGLPDPHGVGGVDRHDEPDRARRGVRRRCAPHEGREAGRRHLPDHRAEDLHHVRRARPDRADRPPRPRPDPGRAARHQGHLAVHRPQVPRRRRRDAGRAQRRPRRVDRAQDGHQGQPDLRPRLRRRR